MRGFLETAVVMVFLTVGLAGCTDDGPDRDAEAVSIGQFEQVTQVIPVPGDNGKYVVLERGGLVWLWWSDNGQRFEVLNLSDRVSVQGERGLAAFAFHPDFQENGMAFVAYTKTTGGGPTDRNGFSYVDRIMADPETLRGGFSTVANLIQVPWVNWYHNIGGMRFGPDGMLYIGVGDGSETIIAQNLSSHKGKVLRINVDGASGYEIPEDNPFVGRTDAKEEIWLYGLRNAWRFDFTSEGDMFIADVGSSDVEEVNLYRGEGMSRHFGWPHYEGSEPWRTYDSVPDSISWPIVEYRHEGRCAVIGGTAYSGDVFSSLQDRFIIGDHCSGEVFIVEQVDDEWQMTPWFTLQGDRINSIDRTHDGEVLVSTMSGRILEVRPSS